MLLTFKVIIVKDFYSVCKITNSVYPTSHYSFCGLSECLEDPPKPSYYYLNKFSKGWKHTLFNFLFKDVYYSHQVEVILFVCFTGMITLSSPWPEEQKSAMTRRLAQRSGQKQLFLRALIDYNSSFIQIVLPTLGDTSLR